MNIDFRTSLLAAFFFVTAVGLVHAQDKVPLDDAPKPTTAPTDDAKGQDLATALKGMPDGVLRVHVNSDGSFKSLVVKSTVEIEDALGGDKGKRMARKEAEIQCKRELAQWLSENCNFTESSDNTTTFVTKGDSSKDAAGNVVKIRQQAGKEVKVFTEHSESVSKAVLNGLTVLQSEVPDGGNEYMLIMGLSQKTMANETC